MCLQEEVSIFNISASYPQCAVIRTGRNFVSISPDLAHAKLRSVAGSREFSTYHESVHHIACDLLGGRRMGVSGHGAAFSCGRAAILPLSINSRQPSIEGNVVRQNLTVMRWRNTVYPEKIHECVDNFLCVFQQVRDVGLLTVSKAPTVCGAAYCHVVDSGSVKRT